MSSQLASKMRFVNKIYNLLIPRFFFYEDFIDNNDADCTHEELETFDGEKFPLKLTDGSNLGECDIVAKNFKVNYDSDFEFNCNFQLSSGDNNYLYINLGDIQMRISNNVIEVWDGSSYKGDYNFPSSVLLSFIFNSNTFGTYNYPVDFMDHKNCGHLIGIDGNKAKWTTFNLTHDTTYYFSMYVNIKTGSARTKFGINNDVENDFLYLRFEDDGTVDLQYQGTGGNLYQNISTFNFDEWNHWIIKFTPRNPIAPPTNNQIVIYKNNVSVYNISFADRMQEVAFDRELVANGNTEFYFDRPYFGDSFSDAQYPYIKDAWYKLTLQYVSATSVKVLIDDVDIDDYTIENLSYVESLQLKTNETQTGYSVYLQDFQLDGKPNLVKMNKLSAQEVGRPYWYEVDAIGEKPLETYNNIRILYNLRGEIFCHGLKLHHLMKAEGQLDWALRERLGAAYRIESRTTPKDEQKHEVSRYIIKSSVLPGSKFFK